LIVLKCIENKVLPIPAEGPKEIELICRVELIKKQLDLRRRLGYKKSN